MITAYDGTGAAFRAGPKVGGGGQGTIWCIEGQPTYCLKVYHQAPAEVLLKKLRLLQARAAEMSKVAALPVSLAFKDSQCSLPVGVFLPFIPGREIFELYGTRSRLKHFPQANFRFLAHTAYNLAVAFEVLHAAGIIVGDVNEQNIKVLPDATIRFIDCDSFQIRNGNTVFTSDVGTPLWTPPELQGKNLTGYERTTNHDLFGLAQLIFLLLFTGRHPFAGVSKAGKQLQPEEAIRERAFAFAPPEYNVPLGPPPGSPTLNCLPPDFRAQFISAFIDGSGPAGRPTAVLWKASLETLSKTLVACARHRNHFFWKGVSACPWCEVLSKIGVEMFPAAEVQGAAVEGGNTYVAGLTALRPRRFVTFSPAPVDGLMPASLPAEPEGVFAWIGKTFTGTGWKRRWLSGLLASFQRSLASAQASLVRLESEQQKTISAYETAFAAARSELQNLVRQIQNPALIRRDIDAVVSRDRREIELKLFLQGKQVRRAKIANVGPGRTATLISYGIQTAADVSYQAVLRVPGFGHALTSDILSWRARCENQFTFNPSQPLSFVLRQEIERQVQKKLTLFKEEAAKLETDLRKLEMQCADTLRKHQAEAVHVGRQRDQARADAEFIKVELSKC